MPHCRFDPSNGEPSSWQPTTEILAHHWVRQWFAEQWDVRQPRTRKGTAEEMSRFVPLLLKPAAARPPVDVRFYLKGALALGDDGMLPEFGAS